MTINTCVTDTTASALIRKAGVPGLRLVVGGVDEGRRREEPVADSQALPCAELKSAIAAQTAIIPVVLTDLFRSLRQGERIEFVHRIVRSDAGNAAGLPSYRFVVKLACSPEQGAPLKSKVLEALLTAMPGFHLDACTEAAACADDFLVPYVLQVAPSGAVVAAMPVSAPSVSATSVL